MSSGEQQMTHVSGSYEFTGPAEVVFDVLTDPDRAVRWLPGALDAESVTTESVKAGAQEYRVEAVADGLRVDWRSVTESGAHGSARVEDAPAGGSILHAEVTAPASAGDEQAVTAVLDEAMRNLQSDVSDNFNAG